MLRWKVKRVSGTEGGDSLKSRAVRHLLESPCSSLELLPKEEYIPWDDSVNQDFTEQRALKDYWKIIYKNRSVPFYFNLTGQKVNLFLTLVSKIRKFNFLVRRSNLIKWVKFLRWWSESKMSAKWTWMDLCRNMSSSRPWIAKFLWHQLFGVTCRAFWICICIHSIPDVYG